MINNWKNNQFDQIGFTSGENFIHNFPDHFHEEYAIGVAVSGIQQFKLLDKHYIVEPFSLFFIKPGQMHAHHPVADLGWSFRSISLSPDFVSYLFKDQGIHSISSLIQDYSLFRQYMQLYDNGQFAGEKEFWLLMKELVQQSAITNNMAGTSVLSEKMEDIKCYLSVTIHQKLNLENIANKFKIDKYQLIRQFKKYAGVTPNTYLTILRIEKARKLINSGYPIVEAALESGFYDQSHFHRNFLYYTGVTPGKFTRS